MTQRQGKDHCHSAAQPAFESPESLPRDFFPQPELIHIVESLSHKNYSTKYIVKPKLLEPRPLIFRNRHN